MSRTKIHTFNKVLEGQPLKTKKEFLATYIEGFLINYTNSENYKNKGKYVKQRTCEKSMREDIEMLLEIHSNIVKHEFLQKQ